MTGFASEPLAPRHDRSGFSCGVPALDDYLRNRATQDVRRYSAAVFVLLPDNQPTRIAGFYSLSAFSVELDSLPADATKKLARYPLVPAILIGRLARSSAFPGLSGALLMDAITRCVRQAGEIGASLIVVEAKDEKARDFWREKFFDFALLPVGTVAAAISCGCSGVCSKDRSP